MLKIKMQASDTRIRMKPGEYRNCAEGEILVPNSAGIFSVVKGPVKKAFSGATVRVRISRATTST